MSHDTDLTQQKEAATRHYWRTNLKLMGSLLFVWACVSYGCGILFVEQLNQYQLFGTGYPLGFWFAQQGSILVFIGLVFIYAWAMNRIDKKHNDALSALAKE